MHWSGREFRRAPRTRCRNAAWIDLADSGMRIPCVLWDVSTSGARLAAPRAKTLPAVFSLQIANDRGAMQRACRVVWRNDRQVGVQFIEATADELEELASRRQAGPEGDASSSAAAAAFLLPGYGPHFIDKPQRAGLRVSSFAALMLFMLVSATALFLLAGMHSELQAPWAVQVCDTAANFCRHPEWTGIAGGLMAVVYFAVRGMET